MKYIFLSPMVWNHYRYMNMELPIALSDFGNDCIYINPLRYKNCENNSLRFHNVSSHPSNSVKVIERFINLPKSIFILLYESFDNVRMIRRNRPDRVVCFDHLMGIFACIYCKLKRIPFIFVVIDDYGEAEKDKIARLYFERIAKPVLNRLSGAIASTSHKQREVYGKHNKNVFLLPNGKPLSFIKKASGYANNLSHERKMINFIGSLRDWYDFDLLFEVFKEFPELQLNIYGKGDLFNYLKEKSVKYPNTTVNGNVDSEMLPELNAQSLFGILPLKLDKLNDSTCPIKLFDYWSAKKAVIASPTYELKKIGEDGGLILAKTKEEYVAAIKSFLADPSLMVAVAGKGYQNMEIKYNYTVITKQFIEYLDSRGI